MDDAIGCLFGLLFLIVIVVVIGGGLYLFTSSKAVLYSETQLLNGSFECHYFTGTRSVTRLVYSDTGCERFIDVGN